MKKHQVHNLIILDESGSMQSIKQTIIAGFNEIVQTIKSVEKEFPEQEHFISLISFNASGRKILHFIDPASQLEEIDGRRYQPNSGTPLYDTMGYGIMKLRQVLEGISDYNVLVTILTDGQENASVEYTGKAIKNMIEELKPHGWTFTYIGADHDVEQVAESLSIKNTMRFEKDELNMREMFTKEKSARAKYSQKIREKEETSENYYEEENPKNS